ncbi:hypothetical protein D3C85_761000 [compost metagenome]
MATKHGRHCGAKGFPGFRQRQTLQIVGPLIEGRDQGNGASELLDLGRDRLNVLRYVQQLLEFAAADALGYAKHRPHQPGFAGGAGFRVQRLLDDFYTDAGSGRTQTGSRKAGFQGVASIGLGNVEMPTGRFQAAGAVLAQGAEPLGPERGESAAVGVYGLDLCFLLLQHSLQSCVIGARWQFLAQLFVTFAERLQRGGNSPLITTVMTELVIRLVARPQEPRKIQQHAPGVVDNAIVLLFAALHPAQPWVVEPPEAWAGGTAPAVIGRGKIADLPMHSRHLTTQGGCTGDNLAHDALTHIRFVFCCSELVVTPAYR